MRFLAGTQITPEAAASYYGASTTSTDGLCRDYPSNADICMSGARLPSPEIKELARALNYDPDLIYDYMLNTIDNEFMFGAHKGALGALIDKSGDAFDQAELMVALLREAAARQPSTGITSVKYVYGTLTLSGTDFYDWSGISDANAACQYLSAGGIPAVVNSVSSGCPAAGSGAVTTVRLSHIWVEAVISGQTRFYDPSFKRHIQKAGIDLKSGMGFVAGQALTAATTGMTSTTANGLPYVSNLNESALDTKLKTWSDALVTRLQQSDLNGAGADDVIGGQVIDTVVRPAAGWHLTRPSTYNATSTWDNVPDQYRATFSFFVQGYQYSTTGSVPVTGSAGTFFGDEVSGRNIEIGTRKTGAPAGLSGALTTWLKMTVWLEHAELSNGPAQPFNDMYTPVVITINHPFAALSGTYGDNQITKMTDITQAANLVHGWGDVSNANLTKLGDEKYLDHVFYPTSLSAPPRADDPNSDNGIADPQSSRVKGDLIRSKIALAWLGEFNQALEIHARLAKAHPQHLDTFGMVSSVVEEQYNYQVNPGGSTIGTGFYIVDEAAVVDLDTSLALTSDVSSASTALTRRAALHAIAATGAALEGSVVSQLSSVPDAQSTAERFRWGNRPTSDETASLSSRQVVQLPPSSAGWPGLALTFDGMTGAPQSFTVSPFGTIPAVNSSVRAAFMNRASDAMVGYGKNGFEIVASTEASLAPGHIHGGTFAYEYDWYDAKSGVTYPHIDYDRAPSLQRGAALVASKYNASGDPEAIAHIITRYSGEYKGGGGTTRIFTGDGQGLADKGAGLLKSRFEDRSEAEGVDATGNISFSTPVLDSVGQGDFPYRLEQKFETSKGMLKYAGSAAEAGYTPQFVPSLSGYAELSDSAVEAMGSGRVDGMAGTLTAFIAMQDIWSGARAPQRETSGLLATSWWLDSLSSNVLTIHQGGGVEEYQHIKDTTYLPVSGGASQATVTGSRQAKRLLMEIPNPVQTESPTRVWDYGDVSIQLTGANGDVRSYEYWGNMPDRMNRSLIIRSGFHLKTWTFPQGVTLTYTYPTTADDVQTSRTQYPTAITSNLGYSLDLTFGAPVACTDDVTATYFTDKLGHITKISLGGGTISYPDDAAQVIRPYSYNHIQSIFTADDLTTSSQQYVYDSLGRVKFAYDGIAIRAPAEREPYEFFIADGFRHASKNPLGGFYATETSNGGRFSRNIDELGRVVTSTFDGRGRVTSRTYPEADQEQFKYDLLDHVIELRKKPKPCVAPCTAPADIVTQAGYESTWHKLSYAIDANNNRTDFTYYSSGNGKGQLATVQMPAVNAVRPAYGFTYTATGRIATQTDPMNVVTSLSYNAKSDLTGQVVDPTGLNLATGFGVDSVGNTTSVTDPLGHVSYLTYNPMRQVVFEIGADPDGTGTGTPLKRQMVHHLYDAQGREYRTENGAGDSVTGSDFSMTTYTQKTFDAVGNVTQTAVGQ